MLSEVASKAGLARGDGKGSLQQELYMLFFYGYHGKR
jgi:hypothetical protein